MILENGCNITKSEKCKGVWILSVPTVYTKGFLKTTNSLCVFAHLANKADSDSRPLPNYYLLLKSLPLNLSILGGSNLVGWGPSNIAGFSPRTSSVWTKARTKAVRADNVNYHATFLLGVLKAYQCSQLKKMSNCNEVAIREILTVRAEGRSFARLVEW